MSPQQNTPAAVLACWRSVCTLVAAGHAGRIVWVLIAGPVTSLLQPGLLSIAFLTGQSMAWPALAVGDRLLARRQIARRAERRRQPGALLLETEVTTHTAPTLTLSIGLTLFAPGETLASAMQRADEALYAAKAAGRDCHVARCAPAPLAAVL